MQITSVRIRLLNHADSSLKGIASITIDNEFAVHDIKIVKGDKGLFISMPARKDSDGEWKDICHPLSSEVREYVKTTILEKYNSDIEEHVVEE